jgi:hypothetical protein
LIDKLEKCNKITESYNLALAGNRSVGQRWCKSGSPRIYTAKVQIVIKDFSRLSLRALESRILIESKSFAAGDLLAMVHLPVRFVELRWGIEPL